MIDDEGGMPLRNGNARTIKILSVVIRRLGHVGAPNSAMVNFVEAFSKYLSNADLGMRRKGTMLTQHRQPSLRMSVGHERAAADAAHGYRTTCTELVEMLTSVKLQGTLHYRHLSEYLSTWVWGGLVLVVIRTIS